MISAIEILVEGYDDRAFWAGLLVERFGWRPGPSFDAATLTRLGLANAQLRAPWKGAFTFLSPGEDRIARLVPYQEQAGVPEPRLHLLRSLLGPTIPPLLPPAAVIECLDDDSIAEVGWTLRHTPAGLREWLRQVGVDLVADLPLGARTAAGVEVHRVVWASPDGPGLLPGK